MYQRGIKKALPFWGFEKLLWCTRAQSTALRNCSNWSDLILQQQVLHLDSILTHFSPPPEAGISYLLLKPQFSYTVLNPVLVYSSHWVSTENQWQFCQNPMGIFFSSSAVSDAPFCPKEQPSKVKRALISPASEYCQEAIHITCLVLTVSSSEVSEQEQVTDTKMTESGKQGSPVTCDGELITIE